MGGTSGVKPRGKSIHIGFAYRKTWCRETLKLKPTAQNLKYAERLRSEILNRIEKGTFSYAEYFPDSPRAAFAGPGHVVSVKEYLAKWLDRTEQSVKASTYRDYKNTVQNHLIPAFGASRLASLSRLEIRTWASELQASNKRIANLISPLRQALHDAVDDGLLDANPLDGWHFRRREEPKDDDVDPFTAEEQAAILGVLEGQARNLIQFALWTGLRTSELVALEWRDINWINRVARISRAQTQAASKPETPKTAAGRRDVKLLAPAYEALESQKHFTFLANGRVFHNPRTDEPWTGDQAIRKTLWQYALKRAGVRYRRPYQTRHTYASMALSAGENPLWVATQMGHRDWTMIARRYGKWMKDSDPNAGQNFEQTFAKTTPILHTSHERLRK